MAGLKTKSRNIVKINQQLNDSEYVFVHFEQPYFNGYSDVYYLHNAKTGTTIGYSVRTLIEKLNARILTKFYQSKDELDKNYGSIVIDSFLNRVESA